VRDDIRTELRMLEDQYTEAVNSAVGEDREDLVRELVASYPDAALRVLTSAPVDHAA
jgi:hypothetical protein